MLTVDAHTAKNKELADTQPVNQFGIALPYLSENDEDLVSFTRRSRILPLETSVKQSAAEEFLQDEVTPKNAPLISKSRSKRLFADATFPSGSCSSHSGDDVVNDSMDDASCSDSSSPRLKIPAKSTGGTIYMRENVDAILSPLLSSRRSHAVRDSDSDDIECHKILTSPLRTCSHCHKSLSTQWHAVGDGTELCAQCYQYFAKHGSFDGCPSSGSKPTRVKDFTFLKKKRAVQGLCHAKESTTAVKKRDQTQKPMKSSKLSITSSPVIRKVVSPTLGLDSTEKRRYVQYKDTSESSSSSENDDACDRDYQPTQQKTKSGLSKVERKRRRVSIHTSGVNTERVKKKPLPIAEMKQATVEPSRSSFKKNDLVWALDLESKHFRQVLT